MGSLSQHRGYAARHERPMSSQGAQIDEKAIARTEAIILSMTPEERENPQMLRRQPEKADRRRLRYCRLWM